MKACFCILNNFYISDQNQIASPRIFCVEKTIKTSSDDEMSIARNPPIMPKLEVLIEDNVEDLMPGQAEYL